MSNITTTTNSLPATYTDPLEELAAEARDDLGNLLKFIKGEWSIGDDKVPEGTEYVAHVDHLVRGWIRFDDGKVAERILRKRDDKRRMPDRDELSFAEQHSWPRDSKGVPRDPWVRQLYLPLIAASDGELVTFITGTVGGRIAVGKLCDAFLNNNRRRPIVALDVGGFKSREYGKVEAPAFKIVSFEEGPAEPEPESKQGEPEPEILPAKTAPTKPRRGAAGDMDDEIPF